MTTIQISLIWHCVLCLVIAPIKTVTHIFLDENHTYRAWTAPGAHGRCITEAGSHKEEWHFQDIKGTRTDELLADPCAYKITCPNITTYDEQKVLCTIEPDWNRSLSTCKLGHAVAAQGTSNDTPASIQAATLDADKQYKCFINNDIHNGRFFYPRDDMQDNVICGSNVYAVTEKDAPEAILADKKEGDTIIRSNVLCHTYTYGDHKPTCGRTKTTHIASCLSD